MPCYTIREVSVDLTVADVDVLIRGLKAAGFTLYSEDANYIAGRTPNGLSFTIEDGQVRMQDLGSGQRLVEDVARQINAAYAEEAVQTAAERFGWSLETDLNTTTGNNVHTLTRKAF